MACTATTRPCGSDPVMVTLSGGDHLLAFPARVDQVDDMGRQRR